MPQTVMECKIAPVRETIRDLRSNIRWIIGLAVVWVLYTLVSSAVICLIEEWGYWHSCYFTLINITTVGFGDIAPVTQGGKIVAGVNSVAGLVLFGFFVASITMALQPTSFEGIVKTENTVDLSVESRRSNEEKVSRFLETISEFISLDENAEESGGGEYFKVIDMHVDVDRCARNSKLINIRILIKARRWNYIF